MIKRRNLNIRIKRFPVQLPGTDFLHAKDLLYCGVPENRIIFIRNKKFLFITDQPETVTANGCNFRQINAFSTRL